MELNYIRIVYFDDHHASYGLVEDEGDPLENRSGHFTEIISNRADKIKKEWETEREENENNNKKQKPE